MLQLKEFHQQIALSLNIIKLILDKLFIFINLYLLHLLHYLFSLF